MIKTKNLITFLKQNKHSISLYPDSLYYEYREEIIARLKELDKLKSGQEKVNKYEWKATKNEAVPKTKRKIDELLRSGQ